MGTYNGQSRDDKSGEFGEKINTEPEDVIEIDPWTYDGDDVDAVAARDGWVAKDWENYYDGRRERGENGGTCSECGAAADPDLDELCRDCANDFDGVTEDDDDHNETEFFTAAGTIDEVIDQQNRRKFLIQDLRLHPDLVDRVDRLGDSDLVYLKDVHALGGYDFIMTDGDITKYFLTKGGAHQLHREDGPAHINRSTGEETPWLNGVEQKDPDPTIGHHFVQFYREPRNGLCQVWRSGNGNYEAHRFEDGSEHFLHDGEFDRSGGPASITPHGELWYRFGKLVADPRPQPSTTTVNNAGTARETTTIVGAKYDPSVTAGEISAKSRKDLEHARYTGLIPEQAQVKVTTRKDRYGSYINVAVSNLYPGVISPNQFNGDDSEWYTEEGEKLRQTVSDLVNQYNYRETGPGSDPRNTTVFLHVSLEER